MTAGEANLAGVGSQSVGRDAGPAPFPLVPIVRSLVEREVGSPEFVDAVRCAGQDEIDFALEIINQRLANALARREELRAERDNLAA